MLDEVQFRARPSGPRLARFLAGAAAAAMMIANAGPATAQVAATSTPAAPDDPQAGEPPVQSQGLADIVVTAQRRTERLQDVPIAVTAIGSETLQTAGIDRIADLPKLAPSLTFVEVAFSQNLGIRGIFSGENQGLEQSVGTYVDGISRGRPFQARIPFMDVERVEVLRGPQSLLFGKNSVAGALNVTTAQPTSRFEGYVDGEAVHYDTDLNAYMIEGAVSGPLTDALRFRVAARYNDSDGYMNNNQTGKGFPNLRERQIRAILAYDVTPNLTVNLKGEYDYYKRGGLPEETADESPAAAGPFAGLTYAQILVGLGQPTSVLDNVSNWQGSFTNGYSVNRAKEFVLTAKWNLDPVTLTSISGYSGYKYRDLFDADFTAANFLTVQSQDKYDQFSQEIRFESNKAGRLNYMGGIYLEHNEYTYDENALFPTGSIIAPIVNGVASGLGDQLNNASLLRHVHQISKTASVFAQLTYHLTDNLRLAGGLRYFWGRKEASRDVFEAQNGLPAGAGTMMAYSGVFNVNAHTISGKRTDRALLPSITLEGNPAPGILAYVSWKRGAKSGGFDARSNNLPYLVPGLPPTAVGTFEFKNEQNDAFEAGTKISIGRKAEINLAAYYQDFKRLQISLYDGGLGYNVGNAASAKVKGLEVDTRWSITPALSAHGALALTDFNFGTFYGLCYVGQKPDAPNGLLCNYKGKSNQYVPDWNGNVGLNWQHEVFDDYRLSLSADTRFSGSYFAQGDLNPLERQKTYAMVDARIAVGPSSKQWEVGFSIRNLTDHYVIGFASNTPLAANIFGAPSYLHVPLQPRSFVLQARTRF